ncbi:alanine--tRNA ligase [Fibrella aquatilis]|uniref:Alanine--tRNA ligase n=1 Tax=Fibrella aquatilis TaxID=2817059 RepID=A0A939GAK0_9BACT|nr:alanine--tRNA ligase [Fibrella aquatilis]MBO0934025.1 alanine--tRNA ligase [Fibrella aquatilis]
MTSSEIRRQFLDFFRSKGHLIVPSAPLVAKNDPTLMFNNSGMAQFKDFFLGNGTPPAKRVADTQKCLRVSGKHNDLEDVGFDTYHHTMFEMLGNWSFGDYFKKEALEWSWELLTDVFKLPKDRIYVSVFKGDETDGVPFDQESWDIWKGIIGRSGEPDDSRIILGNKKDNFWEMGATGPCGPCSEIHIDLRSPEEVAAKSGKELVNADHPQVVEIWNNVFMQFNRKADGSLEELPARHVDTGMGFERLCMAIQGKQSNYDTDVFSGTINLIEQLSGRTYTGKMEKSDVAMRVIADHIRAVSFAIGDGLVPSNAKAGYVIRRILRRAIRYGYSYLGFTEPFMCKLVPLLADQFADVFPELDAQQEFVATVIREEETAFLRTLGTGLTRLDQIIEQLGGAKTIPGETVFELNDTFGFPADLTALIAREKGLSIDELGFETALQAQKQRSRKDASYSAGDWIELQDVDTVEFVGYDQLSSWSQVVKYRRVQNKQGTQVQVVLDKTPFYAESGGQIGDTGRFDIYFDNGGEMTSVPVLDTRKENNLTIHILADQPGLDELLQLADGQHAAGVSAEVDAHRRELIADNHSATHLMHSALREVLGPHVAQKGSYVGPDALRFDFSHFGKMTDEEINRVETIVNERIRQNIPLDEKRNVPIDQARAMGATALFGEKYGDFVRVITFDPTYSVELCGGTHVPSTGQIGLFKLTSEGSVSTGVRRIEAKTSEGAWTVINEQLAVNSALKELLKAPKDVVKAVQTLLDERAALQKQVELLENEKIQQLKNELLGKIIFVKDSEIEAPTGAGKTEAALSFLVERVTVPNADALKQLAYDLKAKVDNIALVLGADINGKPQLAVMLPDSLIKSRGLNAGQIVKDLAKHIKGGGGGQPFFATAGGTDVTGLDAALAQGRVLLNL